MFEGFPRVTVKHEVDEVIEYIKGSDFYDYYRAKVLEEETETNTFLNRRTILETQRKNDPKMMLFISAAAHDMLFSMIDQKLRNEILIQKDY